MARTVETFSTPPYNQGHLFDGATEYMKESIVHQLEAIDAKLPGGGLQGYLERARRLLADAQADRNPCEGLVPKVPNGVKLVGSNGPGSNEYTRYERLGMDELEHCCFCLVAGGLGERLGFPGIKIGIVSDVTTNMSFIELYISFILAFQQHARKKSGRNTLELPLVVMTSDDTDAPTRQLFMEQHNFALSDSQLFIVKQEKVPALKDVEGRIASNNGKIETKPHGHGDVHAVLHQNGLPEQWVSQGRKWLVIFQDTNPLLFRSICAVIGVSAEKGFAMNSVAVPRIPGESIGGITTLEDPAKGESITVNVEYNFLGPLLRDTAMGGDVADESGFSPYPGNINVLVFGLQAMAKCLSATSGVVPEFVNPKWVDACKTSMKAPTRLECMMQDFPRLCTAEEKVGFTMMDRWVCKTSVKNNLADAAKKNPPECALSAEADIYTCCTRMLQAAGAEVEIAEGDDVAFLGIKAKLGPRVVLLPSFAISIAQLKERIRGPVRISKRSTLIVEGEIDIAGLELDGALKLHGSGSIQDLKVNNAGCPIEAIPSETLQGLPPSLQIRGYTCDLAGMECMQVSSTGH